MKKGEPLEKIEIKSTDISTQTTSIDLDENLNSFQLPNVKYNVLDYGLVGDGITDDTAALKKLSKNINVTNWYFPLGHTFRLYGMIPPPHINTIWGGGELKTIYKPVKYPFGTLRINNNPDTHLLINNIKFTYVSKKYPNGEYGAIIIDKSTLNGVNNVEIRNSTFQGNNKNPSNGISVYGKKENGGTKNINIHNNKFFDIPRAGVEVVHRSDTPSDSDGLENIFIQNNLFDFSNSTGWKCAVSFSQVRRNALVANNTFRNTSWDIEINQAANITIRNNYSTGCKAHFISEGSIGWHGNDVFKIAENLIYSNHFESQTATIHIYNGSKSKYYNNYIYGGIWSQKLQKGSWDSSLGNFYDNTIVKDVSIHAHTSSAKGPSSAIKIEGTGGNSKIYNNDIYIKGTGSDAIIFTSSAVGANTHIENNNISIRNQYSKCTPSKTNATISNNTCLHNNDLLIPNSKDGAGLQ